MTWHSLGLLCAGYILAGAVLLAALVSGVSA